MCVCVLYGIWKRLVWPNYEVVVFQASVSDCSIPRLWSLNDQHFYSRSPNHLPLPLSGSFCFPLSYGTPSLAVVVIALSLTPAHHFLSWHITPSTQFIVIKMLCFSTMYIISKAGGAQANEFFYKPPPIYWCSWFSPWLT